MMKNQKGITLVALVITIIVMLILVTVSVTMAINGGLFNYAKNGTDETGKAVNEEQNLASGMVNVNGSQQDIGTFVNNL